MKIFYCLLAAVSLAISLAAQNKGLQKPQDASTLPVSRASIVQSAPKKKIVEQSRLVLKGGNEYIIEKGWELCAANDVRESAAAISGVHFNSSKWYRATVPGTVLTTLVDQGVYPDPAFGVNNLSIPDTLCRQQWWYRNTFVVDEKKFGKNITLTFYGINYIADVWLNGKKIGDVKGAFKRGIFDITQYAIKGKNTIAILITPPLHPGIPHEESPRAGTGPNGGMLCADGPTFISSEGWDWVPGIRDRNIGIWQDVTLKFTDVVQIDDPQVITTLPLPDTSFADITIVAPVHNKSNLPQQIEVKATIGNVVLAQKISLQANEAKEVLFDHNTFAQLHFISPKLWWPNGYGNPSLYKLQLTASTSIGVSDMRETTFGIREISYELSADAPQKQNSRFEYQPAHYWRQIKSPVFDNIKRRKVVGDTYIPSINKATDTAFLQTLTDTSTAPYLTIKVNGRRIFCKGGNWGMDDYMKRCSRAYLEPYFRLHRDAHFNMVRNWTGESTEEIFYQLCDEYGLLVWNDFWMSTERYNVEPIDNALFLDNVKDVVTRFRNHPCIALWCPRNEGYAPVSMEDSVANFVLKFDGTRHYQPNSRYLNLRTSGPWHYMQPANYFTNIADGFSTELGTPAVPTAASMRKMMATEDVWPISDAWYYHDLHDGQLTYRHAMDSLYGPSGSLDEFCRKAQMINYDSHRAMFESWNSKLYNAATGVLLWMTHPAWPSTVWHVYSWDYETFGAYYGASKACEPVHIQMNLHDNKVVVTNTSLQSYSNCNATLALYDISGREFSSKSVQINVAANQLNNVFVASLSAVLPSIYLARLTLTDAKGNILSQNDYWKNGANGKDYVALAELGKASLRASNIVVNKNKITFNITNTSAVPAVGIKLNLVDKRTLHIILPTFFSNGYFNLLPGESKTVTIDASFTGIKNAMLQVEGLNVEKNVFDIQRVR